MIAGIEPLLLGFFLYYVSKCVSLVFYFCLSVYLKAFSTFFFFFFFASFVFYVFYIQRHLPWEKMILD